MRFMRGASAAGLARRAWRRASPNTAACFTLNQDVVVRRIREEPVGLTPTQQRTAERPLRRCDTTRMVAVVAGNAPGPQQVVGDELADGSAGLESGLVVEGPVDAAVDPAGAGFLRRLREAVEGACDDWPAGR